MLSVSTPPRASDELASSSECLMARSIAGIGWTLGATFALSGLAKLTRAGRAKGRSSALVEVLPTRLSAYTDRVWLTVAATECATGLGLLANSRRAQVGAPVLAAGAVAYATTASATAPHRSCGCMGALSNAPARESLPRAWAMLALAAPCAVGSWSRSRLQTNQRPTAPILGAATSAAVIIWLSPERREALTKLRSRKVDKQLNDSDQLLRELTRSRSWTILKRFIDPNAAPATWSVEDDHYVEFHADSALGDASVGFMFYKADRELRIRGVLARHDTGQVLIKT